MQNEIFKKYKNYSRESGKGANYILLYNFYWENKPKSYFNNKVLREKYFNILIP